MTEQEQLLTLYSACFPEDPPAFWQWIFSRVYRPENTLNVWEDGRIIASLQMIPCTMRYGGELFAAHYIYAASTLPERQGRGLMASLLARAAEEGRSRGHAFSVLITQEDSLLEYYARFGYQGRFEIAYRSPEPAELLPHQRVRTACAQDVAAINALYEDAAAGMLHGVRDREDWLLQLELFGEGAQVLETGDTVTAYAFADERGVLEAAGRDAGILASCAAPGKPWRAVPCGDGVPMGSIKPLREDVRGVMEQNPCFLNLMFN